MKVQRKVVISLFIASILFIMSFLPLGTSDQTVAAATVASLNTTELTIGLGSYGSSLIYFHKIEDKYKVTIEGANKNASYSFSSSNKSIVTVKKSKNGTTGYLTGIKAGTATITCKQTLNGETTTVGKTKVTVEKSSVRATATADRLTIGTGTLGNWVNEPICDFDYRIPDAKYTYTSNSSNFKIKDKKYDEVGAGEGYFGYAQTYTAKKAGTYTITVKETYKKKTRKVGTFKVHVLDFKIVDNYTIEPNETVQASYMLKNQKRGMNYYFEGDGFDAFKKNKNSIVYFTEEYGDVIINGVKEGTAKINVYEGSSESNKKLVGSFTITVANTYITFYNKKHLTYVGNEYSSIYMRTSSNVDVNDITITPSDNTLVSIDKGEKSGSLKRWNINALKKGTVTIVAKYGDLEISGTITIYETEDDFIKAYYENQ
jgi:hypothetical protein